MSDTCKTCRHWNYLPTTPIDLSHCRRYAPRPGENRHGTGAPAEWPKTNSNDWCGEHSEDHSRVIDMQIASAKERRA